MALIPNQFKAGDYTLVIIGESEREFAESKYEYQCDVLLSGKSIGSVELWFLPHDKTDLRGEMSQVLHQSLLSDNQRAQFSAAVFDALRDIGQFKTYGIGDAVGYLEHMGPPGEFC